MSLINFNFAAIPMMMTMSTLFIYVFIDPEKHLLTPELVFVSLSLFNLIRTPITLFPIALMDIIKVRVSVSRISDFLNAEELEDSSQSPTRSLNNSVEVDYSDFTWEDPNNPTLRNVNFEIKKGELIGVVGLVGSGKSSLLSAILGEMCQVSFKESTYKKLI